MSEMNDVLTQSFIRMREELDAAKILIETLQAENTRLTDENKALKKELQGIKQTVPERTK